MPNIHWCALAIQAGHLLLERHETFQKQTYRNRCHILTANGLMRLTVPVKGASRHLPYQDVRINYAERWQQVHLRAIRSAYANAPFFEFIAEDLEAILLKNHVFLYELNVELLMWLFSFMRLSVKISHTDSYNRHYDSNFEDARAVVHPKKPAGIIHAEPYQQVFDQPFVENLSILDLLCCTGPQAPAYLKRVKIKKVAENQAI